MFNFLPKHCIHFAAAGGNLTIFEYFIKDGLSNDYYDANGNTPLHYAAKFGRETIVLFICNQGIDIKIPNKFGWTAGHFAAAIGSLSIIETLNLYGDTLCNRNSSSVYIFFF